MGAFRASDLRAIGGWNPAVAKNEDFERLDTEVIGIVEESVAFAKAGTDPKPEDALKYVYA